MSVGLKTNNKLLSDITEWSSQNIFLKLYFKILISSIPTWFVCKIVNITDYKVDGTPGTRNHGCRYTGYTTHILNCL